MNHITKIILTCLNFYNIIVFLKINQTVMLLFNKDSRLSLYVLTLWRQSGGSANVSMRGEGKNRQHFCSHCRRLISVLSKHIFVKSVLGYRVVLVFL